MNRRERGQTLVIFALTMMLLTLMVCMTLSFGTRAKEKMELQVAADAAAYSNAVVTARTYNVISVLNRIQIADMVAEAGVQSFISWSGAYRGALGTATLNYIIIWAINYLPHLWDPFDPLFGCSWTNTFDIFGSRFNSLIAEEDRIDANWDTLDEAAGLQSLALQGAASNMYPMQLLQYNVLLRLGALQSQSLSGSLATKAASGDPWPGEWSAPGSADKVTIREGAALPPTGAALETGVFIRPEVIAAMGSRGHPFTTGRLDPSGLTFDPQLASVMGNGEILTLNHTGSAYWNTAMVHSASADGIESWADDVPGIETVNYLAAAACPSPIASFTLPYWGWVFSTELSDNTDEHQWGFPFWMGKGGGIDVQPADKRHTLGSCTPLCPGIWPFFMDYNFAKVAFSGDNFGQPKNFAVLQRDYGARPAEQADPWNLLFNFRFTPAAGLGQKFDNTGLTLATGQNISKQVAMATGITYYHRSGSGPTNHWKEPPNFFNPFWRAGLTHADIDDQGATGPDIPNTLGAIGQIPYQDAYNNLKAQGFKGIQ